MKIASHTTVSNMAIKLSVKLAASSAVEGDSSRQHSFIELGLHDYLVLVVMVMSSYTTSEGSKRTTTSVRSTEHK